MSRLSADRILDGISGRAADHLDTLEVFDEIDSTNSYLLGADPPGIGRYRVALAEFQTAGRGRLGRRWLSPAATGVCLSLAFTFGRRQRGLPSLALAVGCGIAESIKALGVQDPGLKWPNDIVVDGAKICGILSEVAPANREGLTVVIGVGLNVDLSGAGTESPHEEGVGRATDLAACGTELPSRSAIAAMLTERIFYTVDEFAADGFAPFIGTWNRFDCLLRKPVRIDTPQGIVAGIADGVDADGALLVKTKDAVRAVTSGTVVRER